MLGRCYINSIDETVPDKRAPRVGRANFIADSGHPAAGMKPDNLPQASAAEE
jgi:hypothetical protein